LATPLDIVLYCGGMPFNGETAYKGSLGGSETACWAVARELAAAGQRVKVFTHGESGIFEGVTYANAGPPTQEAPLGAQFHFFAEQHPTDVLVIQRHPAAYSRIYNAKVRWMWLHDIAIKLHGPMVAGTAWQVDRVLTVSDYHRRQVIQDYGLRPELVTATRNGLHLDWFSGVQGEREPRTLLYSSRPERGLEHLVRPDGIMDRLQKVAPGKFRLVVCHYQDPPQAAQLAGYYQHLYSLIGQRSDCTMVGHLPKHELYKLMGRAWLQVYPTEFPEVSCITAMETQAAGLPILTTNRTALPETLEGAGAIILDLQRNSQGQLEVDEAAFAQEILALDADEQEWQRNGQPEASRIASLRRQCERKAGTYSWSGIAAEWLVMMRDDLKPVHGVQALAKHYLRTSDITALRHLDAHLPDAMLPSTREVFERRYGAWSQSPGKGGSMDDYREKYSDYYRQEFGQPWAPQINLGLAGRGKVVAELLAELPPGTRVLDIGPAEGSFTLSLATALPHLRWECVEMAAENRAMMAQGIQGGSLQERVRLHEGDHERLPEEARGCQVLLCAEVLEHLPDPQGFLSKLLAHMGGSPLVVITTPSGPWEAMLKPEQEYGRVHLHHYERADLLEMFSKMEGLRIIYSPAGQTSSNEQLGHFVTTFKATATPCPIDYERKHRRQRVPGTLSLCMIARDSGHSIGRCLKSTKDWVDEAIVAVDERSEDDTPEVAKRWGATLTATPSPLEVGFDEARNISIASARGNWILWLDSDEELMEPHTILKYLSSRHGDGFGLPQYHYASDVMDRSGAMKVDYPARIFKNGLGIRFFGRVHEHPEQAMNDGPGRVTVISDLKIGHLAYVNETVRQERFRRNLPLMERDRQDYPERFLGKFLWLRDSVYLAQEAMQRGQREKALAHLAESDAMWEAVVEHRNIQLLADALHFRSICNELRQVGWWTGVDLHGVAQQGPPPEPGPETLATRWRPSGVEELMRVLQIFMEDRARMLEPEDLELGAGLPPLKRAKLELVEPAQPGGEQGGRLDTAR